jgi:hypothetical protein
MLPFFSAFLPTFLPDEKASFSLQYPIPIFILPLREEVQRFVFSIKHLQKNTIAIIFDKAYRFFKFYET